MKNKLMKNLPIKLLSIVVAFIIWLVIINIIDPTTTRRFNDIPVEILNENVITSSNQVYEVESGDTVDVTVKGKRSLLEELTNEDFYACADLSKLSTVNTAGIQIKLNKNTKENVELDWNNEVLRISLEEKVSQQFRVEISTEGDLADSYVLGEISTQPNIIEVSGGKSKIKRIAKIGAMVELQGQNSNVETDVTPILFDNDGDVIDSTNVTFSKDTVRVNIKVVPTKSVPVYVDVKGKPADGYKHIQTDYKPDSVMVSGSKEELEKIKSITIPVSVEGAKKDVEKEIDLTKYIGSSCKIEDEFNTVSIRCVIERNGKRSFSFVNSDINLKNLPSNMNFSYADENERHNITVIGGEAELQNVTLTSLGASIDVGGLSAGRHVVEVKFDLPQNIKLKTKVKVEILLTESVEDQPADSPEPTATDQG